MAENTNVFKSSMNALKEKVGNMEINAQTVITVLRFAMEVVEATQLKGEAQKELAIKLVRQIVVEAPISDDKEKLLLDMIDAGILSDTVESEGGRRLCCELLCLDLVSLGEFTGDECGELLGVLRGVFPITLIFKSEDLTTA